MKAAIRDSAVLMGIRPFNLIGYLRAKGWVQFSERAGVFSVWHLPRNSDSEITVPLLVDSSDYANRILEALQELESVESRSQLTIFRDILNAGFDIVRISARSQETNDGTIRIEDGVSLFAEAREMLMSAACATVRPRAVFHSRKPQQALEYMKEARLGQTEHGSYVLTILSPVSPQLNAYSETELFPEDPFQRRVVQTLSESVAEIVSAAAQSVSTNNFEPFQRAVERGVSANLCEAVSRLFKVGNSKSVAFDVSWAQNRPQPSGHPTRTLINQDIIPTIEEAARIFRARDSLDGYHVQGSVIKLERSGGDGEGRVTVLAKVEDIWRKIVVLLPTEEYDRALTAHREFKSVKITGNIVKDGRTYRLDKPSGFDFAPDEEDFL